MVNPWDEYAEEYARLIAEREHAGSDQGALAQCMFEQLGDLAGREVLDAACGEGFFSRLLAQRGARVTGIDLSPRLIETAVKRSPEGLIIYRVGDLSGSLPDLECRFDAIASHLALNDVADFRGFAASLAAIARPGAPIVLGFNNPYSAVVRGHVLDYFESGATGMYGGLAERGVPAHYFHRTLGEYIDAFLDAGLGLCKLFDVRQRGAFFSPPLAEGAGFPLFTVLAFAKRAGADSG
jgi:SAM-dependent methyltransferase